MNELENQFNWMASGHQFLTLAHEGDKLIIFERGDLVFIFNFHPTNSYEHYRVGTNWASEHVILMDSDSWSFGGHNRLEPATRKLFFPIIREQWQNRRNQTLDIKMFYHHLYIPSRTAIILCAEENLGKRRIQINGRPKDLPALEEVKVQETTSQITQQLAQTQGLVDKIEMSATIAPKVVGSQEETIAQVGANVVAQDLSSKLDSATKLL